MEEHPEICLHIDGQVFKVKKSSLCEHSDYFQAMFSGNYLEQEQQVITIDVIDANSMDIILRYMDIGLIDLSEYPLSTIGNLAMAANFLQITELIKQIEYCLDLQLSLSNWMETMIIAENSSYVKLEQLSAAFGLLSFKSMKPEYIPTIHKLFWYLSHPYLDTESELHVFKFGFEWISHTETGADALLIILSCLDVKRLKLHDLKEIKMLLVDYENSLAAKVVDCLHTLSVNEILVTEVMKQKCNLCEVFTERVYNEVLSLVKESKNRKLCFTPVVPVWAVKDTKLELVPHYMYTFTELNGFEKWLEVAEKNLWGWNVVSWGSNKLVIVCGEHGRGTGVFMRDVKVYDTLRKEWTWHGVELPSRRHGGVTVAGDLLFVIGGVGGFRVVLDTAIVYDLKQRTFRKIANLPDAIQNPGVCTHNNSVYAAGQKNIYKYEDLGDSDRWTIAVATEIRTNCMMSFKSYIYCIQNYFSHLYRFRPDVDKKLELITNFSNPTAAICNLGDRLMVFTRPMCGHSDTLAVEEYKGLSKDEKPRVIWTKTETIMKLNDVAGSCSLVMSMPPLYKEISQYHKQYLMRYAESYAYLENC